MEDEFKVYWLGLPEEEITVRVVASFFFRCIHRFVSIPAVETGGFCEGTSNLVSVLKKTNQDWPTTRGRLIMKERKKNICIHAMFQ